jgi:hypothetical protein
MFALLIALAAAPAANFPPSEVRKTDTKAVVVSDVRYRGIDREYPKPYDFEQLGVGYTEEGARLCNAAKDLLSDASVPTGWQMESIIIKGAGIDIARDDEATRKRKAAAWAAKQAGRNACTGLHALFSGGGASWMEEMIQPSFDGYYIVDRIILRYGLPLNDVALRDGRTVLDYVADRIDEGQAAERYTRIYGTLRRFGAKHRKELEMAGALPTSAQRRAQLDADLAKSAAAGNAGAMWALANRYAEQGAADKSAQWLQKSMPAVRSSGNSILMTEVGLRLVDTEDKARPPFAGHRAEGVAMLEAAQKYENPKETFGMMDERSYALGWAYLKGKGVPANESVALKHLAQRDAQSARLAAGYLLDRGRRAEAIAYLRAVRGNEMGWAFRDGKNIEDWLIAQPEGACGKDILGGNPCE